jgi:hypothetical protein
MDSTLEKKQNLRKIAAAKQVFYPYGIAHSFSISGEHGWVQSINNNNNSSTNLPNHSKYHHSSLIQSSNNINNNNIKTTSPFISLNHFLLQQHQLQCGWVQYLLLKYQPKSPLLLPTSTAMHCVSSSCRSTAAAVTTTSNNNINNKHLQAFLHQTAAECWCSCISATLPLPSRTNEHDGSCLEAYAPCMTDVKNSRLDPPFSQAQAEADFMLWQRAEACNITVI